MYVGIGFIKIRIYDAYSLKDRRQVLNSVVTKLQNKFNLSVSIVDSGDVWNLAEIGTAVVSSSKQLIESMYQKLMIFLMMIIDLRLLYLKWTYKKKYRGDAYGI